MVDDRFVALHVCRDLGLIVMSTRERAYFGTRVWAQLAQFSLPELENAAVRLRREREELVKTEPVTGWHIDIEANTVVVYVREDVDGARSRLQDRYGPMITTEYGVATVC